MRKNYPSDIKREQFEKIREDIEGATKQTRPKKYDTYDILCYTVHEEQFHTIIPIGRIYTITTTNGQNPIMKGSVCLIVFCGN